MSGYTIGVNSSNVWNFIIRRRTNDEIHPTTKPPARLRLLLHPRRHPRPRKPLHRIPQSRRTAQIRRPGQLCPENNRSQQKTDFHRKKEIIELCREKYETCPGAWFMDVGNFRELDHILKPYGCQLKTAHPFFLPETESVAKETGFEIRTYDRGEILQFAGDNRFDEAFCFDEKSPDMLGVAAISDGKIIGMAGASADSPLFWQIGINVEKRQRAGMSRPPWSQF